jgi:hypothetical protein
VPVRRQQALGRRQRRPHTPRAARRASLARLALKTLAAAWTNVQGAHSSQGRMKDER